MRAALARIAARAQDEHPWLNTVKARQLRASLANRPAQGDDVQRWRLNFRLGKAELDLGNEEQSIACFAAARALLPRVESEIGGDQAETTLLELGVAWLRQGETQNCCLLHHAESCIAPIQGGGLHTDPEGSSRAIEIFEEMLAREPTATMEGTVGRFTAIWLLNLAYMTLGKYPHEVPPQYLVTGEWFASTIEIPRFKNVLPELDVDTFNLAGGVIVDDFNGDRNLDILTSTWDVTGELVYLESDGDGSFSDRTEAAGLRGFPGGLNMIQADYDNDGDVDVFVLRGAWLGPVGPHPNSLFQNHGDGTFTDVTYSAGLAEPAFPTKAGSWADYDLDGDVDLFVGNETSGANTDVGTYIGNKILGDLQAPSQLFRNNGDGTFTDVAQAAGVDVRVFVMGVTWGDYDGDRFPDLYLSAIGPNRLFRNNGDGTFQDLAEKLGVTRPLPSFPTWFWDLDPDGELDLYVSASSAPVAVLPLFPHGLDVDSSDPATKELQDWVRSWIHLPCMYRGDGQGGFTEVSRENKLTWPILPMGANFGDLDNDGYLDFYLATGGFSYSELRPNLMFLQRPGKGFVDVTASGGFGHLQKGHAVAFADIDNDGDQDIYVQLGGAAPGDKYSDALFENPGFGNHWITVQVVGVKSNRGGIGARLHARVNENGASRSIYKVVNSGGSFGASPLRQTLGLGPVATRIEVLEVFWPVTGETQRFEDVPVDQAIRIVEGEAQYTRLELAPFRLGAE